MRRKVAAALVVALALALAGCGGSEKPEVVSRAEAVQRLEAACRAGQRAARTRLGGRPDATAFVFAMRDNLDTIVDRVGNVEVSGGGDADFAAYMRTVQRRLDAIDTITEADRSDWQSAIAAERRTFETATDAAHEAIVGLGAWHLCV
ncbi:MAG TPA: hypothetical protein VFS37_14685 [Conexibacter sp.]|nr:hypothetical protein [Conexibacter sp.]